MGTMIMDLRLAARTLLRRPGFLAVILLTLAIGIGTTTAVFGVVEGVLLRPLPFPDTDRIFYLWERVPDGRRSWVSAPNFRDWRERLDAFERVSAVTPGGFNASGPAGPERIRGMEVTPGFFETLGLPLDEGRGFRPEEGQSPAARTAVISHALRERQFGPGSSAVGASVELEKVSYEVVGVLPAGLAFPEDVDVWVPLDLEAAEWMSGRGTKWLNVIARARPDLAPEEAVRSLEAVGTALARDVPELAPGSGIHAVPIIEELFGDVRTPLLILSGAVLLVLLVVCINVTGLFLLRAEGRRREAAIRRALGGGRGRLVRHFLAETMLASLAGGALGMVFAHGAVSALRRLAPSDTPRVADAALSIPVLLVGLGISLLAGVACGLIPAFREARTEPREHLVGDGPRTTGGTGRVRRALAVAQVALAVVLVMGAGHLLETFRNLRSVDPGFRSEGVIVASLPLSDVGYETDQTVEAFYREVVRRARGLPDVEEAAVVSVLPLGGGVVNFSFELRDPSLLGPDPELVGGHQSVSAGYFDVMGIPVTRGRAFRDGDRAADEPVVIVDETFAERFFPGADPLGQEILTVGDQWRRVVGVVGPVRRRSLRSGPEPMFYVPFGQDPRDATLVARTTLAQPAVLGPELRRLVAEVDPDQPVASLASLESLVAADLAQSRFTATIVAFFGAAALLLAMLGVYGVLSHMVADRTREMGLRIALGAGSGRVTRMVFLHGLALAAVGLALGIAGAVPALDAMRAVFYGVVPFQPAVVIGVVAVLVASGVMACWLPARRATRVDPAVSLRSE